jgi:glycerol-3-phosphate acyltransferase PlsY
VTELLILIIVAYFLGAVPFGFLIAKAHGQDLRKVGSGNIGATNTGRTLGKKWGIICMVLDSLKGLLPMLAAKKFVSVEPTVAELSLWLAVGCAAIIGHIFPVYLKFKGGKGVATSLGMVLGLWPYYTLPGLVAVAIWVITVLITRYVSLASIIAAASFPLTLFVLIGLNDEWDPMRLWPLIAVALTMPGLVVIRHLSNIKRLIDGTEQKVLQKKQP